MRVFDYSFLKNGLLSANFINITNKISELKTFESFHKEDFPDIFIKLESVAKVQSVKRSNEIEGIITSEERINEIANQSSAPLNHDEMEIAGYRDALNAVHERFSTLDARAFDLLELHKMLLFYTPQGGGIYKSSDNVIMEIDSQKDRDVRFTPTSTSKTAEAMEQLTLAYLDARNNVNINQRLPTMKQLDNLLKDGTRITTPIFHLLKISSPHF